VWQEGELNGKEVARPAVGGHHCDISHVDGLEGPPVPSFAFDNEYFAELESCPDSKILADRPRGDETMKS
jgi:hypothetical protein